MLVTTLPITVGTDPKFFTLMTPFIAHMVGTALEASTIIMTNTVGMKTLHAVKSKEQHFGLYQEQVKTIGIPPSLCEHDGSNTYAKHFRKTVTFMERSGMFRSVIQGMAWCSCGRIEVPTEVVHTLIHQGRHKSLIKGDTFATARCKICGSTLRTGNELVRVLDLPRANTLCLPRCYTREVEAVIERTSARPVIVSRNHRGSDTQFDTDFRWYSYLCAIRGHETDVVLVTSPTTLNQAIKVIACTSLLAPEVRSTLLIHPLVHVSSDNASLSTASIQEMCHLVRSVLARRILLALGVQWTSKETVIRSDEVHRIVHSAPLLSGYTHDGVFDMALEEFMRMCNRNTVNTLLKSARAEKPLDTKLLAVLCSGGLCANL